MKTSSNVVSLHPYFKVNPGQLAAFKANFPKFIEKTGTEKKCLHYDFTVNGDVVHCREAYIGAEGLLAHLENVDALVKKCLEISTLARLEVHGSKEELAKLREPLKALNPEWYVYECGLK